MSYVPHDSDEPHTEYVWYFAAHPQFLSNGWVQDFGGGSDHPGTLMLADGTTTPYWVYGGVWTQYLTVDHGVASCHGYPTSMLSPFANSGLGSDSYLRQNFQTGYIV